MRPTHWSLIVGIACTANATIADTFTAHVVRVAVKHSDKNGHPMPAQVSVTYKKQDGSDPSTGRLVPPGGPVDVKIVLEALRNKKVIVIHTSDKNPSAIDGLLECASDCPEPEDK